MRRIAGNSAVALMATLGATGVQAQQGVDLSGLVTLGQFRTVRDVEGEREQLSAASFGFGAAARLGVFGIEGRYLQTDLAGDGTAMDREVSELELFGSLAPTAWLRVATGLHLRAYRTVFGTERWRMWELRVRGETTILPGVTGHAELWPVLAAGVNGVEAFDSGWGGRAGIRLAPSGIPLDFALDYRTERQRLGAGARRDVVDGIQVTVRLR